MPLVSVIGGVGAVGSLLVGSAQLVKILRTKKADDVSTLDYALRAVAAAMLGIYATSMMDWTFLIVNFGSALLSAGVLAVAWRVKRRRAGRDAKGSSDPRQTLEAARGSA
jgi:hypothetical protein